MKSDICNTNGRLIDVITILTAHWEAGERACKRDKIKRDSSCSNFSHISGSKLHSTALALTPTYRHCWHLLLCSFRGCSCEDAGWWAGKRSSGNWAGRVRFWNESEGFCHPVSHSATSAAAAQSCLDKMGGDGEELVDSMHLQQLHREMLNGEKAEPLPAMGCDCCEVHMLLWHVF